jgi:hypothetical protein
MRIEPKIWIVIEPTGLRHLVDKEPLEGILVWARGQQVTVIEYSAPLIVHPPTVTK